MSSKTFIETRGRRIANAVKAIRVRPAQARTASIKVFMLDAHGLPGPSIRMWEGPATLRPGGESLEVRIA